LENTRELARTVRNEVLCFLILAEKLVLMAARLLGKTLNHVTEGAETNIDMLSLFKSYSF
jgi:hypothetical protein